MTKIKENWLSILLAVVVILSMLLSALLWTNSLGYEWFANNDAEKGTTQQTALQSVGDIYLPTQVILTKSDESQQLLYGQKKNLILTLRNDMQKWQLSGFRRVARNDSSDYLNYLRNDDSIMLSYPDAMATGIFNQTFSQSVDSKKMSQINHIVIPLKGRDVVYLLDDDDFTVYRLNITQNANRSKIKKLVQKSGQRIDVDHKIVDNQPIVTYPHAIKLPVFAYQLTTQDIDNLTQNLLRSTNSSVFTTKKKGNDTIYMDGASKRLDYHRDTSVVSFANYLGKDSTYQGASLYRHLYKRLTATGTTLDWMRFDAVNEKKQTIVFRSYVEGFPIFNDHGYGTVKLQANADGVERCQLSLYSLGVPLPINESKVKLPPSSVVYNELRQAGKDKEVSRLRIGYRWDNQDNDTKVVKLEPTYYVYYHGKWVDYQTLTDDK